MIVLCPYSRLEVSETWHVLTIAKLRAQTGWSWNESKPACPSVEIFGLSAVKTTSSLAYLVWDTL